MFDFNVLAAAVAAIASGALGAAWYSPALFLKPWTKAVGREPKQTPGAFGAAFAGAFAAAFAFAWWLGPSPELATALARGVAAGACFAAGSLGVNYAFADRGWTLWLVDGGFHVARFLVFALVLGLWR